MQTKAHKLTEKWKLFTRTQRSGKQGVYVTETETEKGRERSMLNKKRRKKKQERKYDTTKEVKAKSAKRKAHFILQFFVVVIVDITICKYNLQNLAILQSGF